jgi:hypothetical protein
MPAGAVVTRKGNLWYYKYPDSQIHHWDMGKYTKPFMEATLVPYWAGSLTSGGSKPIWLEVALALAAAAATVWAVTRISKGGGDGRPRSNGPTRRARSLGGRREVG